MDGMQRKVSLGFSHEEFDPGLHICQIVNGDEERIEAILKFVASGLEADENVACYSNEVDPPLLESAMPPTKPTFAEARNRGMFSHARTSSVYFKDGRFDPDRMVALLAEFLREALSAGRSGARVIGEMASEVLSMPGGSRLLEYESKITLLLRGKPMTAVCQYDARLFDGSTIMDVLKVHPLMIVRGAIVRNPFFTPPEEYLASE